MPEKKQKIEIFYDGKCPMCSAIMNKVGHSNQRARFDLRDMHEEDLPVFLTKDALDKEIYAVDADGKVYRNAEAILQILRAYPRLKSLSWIGSLPLIRTCLSIGYGIVAANRRFIFGPASRVFWLKVTVSLGFVASLLISSRLWLHSRMYPLTPAIAALPPIPHPIDILIFVGLFLLLLAAIVSSKPQKYMWSFLGLIGLLCLMDQSRWQPWVFQYSFILVALGLFSWDSNDVQGQKNTLNALRIIIFGTYLYSGLQKINISFAAGVFPWLVEPVTNLLPQSQLLLASIIALGFFAPFIQIGFALGLLTKKFRNLALTLAIIMHVFILAMIGPLGHDWNSVVWPWTTAMIFFDLLLFAGTCEFTLRDIFWGDSIYQKVLLVMFLIMPLLSFFNAWDSYMSAALYSGNTNRGIIYIDGEIKPALPASIATYVYRVSTSTDALSIDEWSIGELKVPPYPEDRIYKNIARYICTWTGNSSTIRLVIADQRMFNDGTPQEYTCQNL